MTTSLNVKTIGVQSALKRIQSLRKDWLSITITSPERSGEHFVLTATTGSSGDTETLLWSDEWPTISIEALVGSFLLSLPNERKEKLDS